MTHSPVFRMKTCLRILVFIALALLPLKVWRAFILHDAKVAYFPGEFSLLVKDVDSAQHTVNGKFKIKKVDMGIQANKDRMYVSPGVDLAAAVEELKSQDPEVEAVNYWSFGGLHLAALGIWDRFNDLSFLNLLGLIVFAWFATTAQEAFSRSSPGAVRSLRLRPAHFLAIVLLWLVFGGLPLLIHAKWDHGPIHGAFWTLDVIQGVWLTQVIDAVLFMAASLIAAFLLVMSVRLWCLCTHYELPNTRHWRIAVLEVLLNAFYLAPLTLAALSLYGVVTKGIQKIGHEEIDVTVAFFTYWGAVVFCFGAIIVWIFQQNLKYKTTPRQQTGGVNLVDVEWKESVMNLLYIRLKPNYPDPP